VDPGALLDDSVLLLAHRIRQMDVTVERHYRAVKPFPGAAGDLRQVFVNLIDNALDALTPPGKIWLRTHSHRCPGGAESLVVVIADSGRGIPSEIRKQLFQPLFTTKGDEGTGLGLWITREILQKHGARIHVRSRTTGRWQGTCFRIVIPLPHPPVA
jgi:signal transduction histidine kinase